MKIWLASLFSALVLVTSVWTAHAQNPAAPPPAPLKVEKIHDDLYVITGDGGNSTVYLTDEGVIITDPKNDRNHDELVALVKTLSDKPIKYVINTHAHGDHTGGNQKMLPAAQTVGHVNARATMLRTKLPGAPQVTYTDQMSIFLGGKEVVLRYFGPCHTDGDTFLYLPAAKVLATGDCFNTGNGRGLNPTGSTTPGFYADASIGGKVLGFAKAADAALKLDWDVVVPGHGPLTNRAGFQAWRKDVGVLTDRVGAMVRAGKTTAEVQDVMVKEFRWEMTGQPFRSVEAMMAEFKP